MPAGILFNERIVVTQFEGSSEREDALCDVVRILAVTMLDLGAPPARLRSRLSAIRHTAFAAGRSGSVKILDSIIDDLFPPPEAPPKPPLRLV
jgi:hypothetical protein